MLTACFDAAGKHESTKCVVVAGFAANAGVWSEFERRWTARLDVDHLPYFHAESFAHFRWPFDKHWEGDESRRRKLLQDLFRIITESHFHKLGTIVRVADVVQATSDNSFTFAALNTADHVYDFAANEGITKNIRFIFEKGDPEDALRKAFREVGYQEPDFMWSTVHTDSKGVTHDPFVGLQASDWLAYEYCLDAERMMYSSPRKRWALQQFETLNGRITQERT